MKYFLYFEQTEGGMEIHKVKFGNENIYFALLGWLSEEYGCKEQDEKLIEWVETAKIGDHFNHRMGTCVRVNNIN